MSEQTVFPTTWDNIVKGITSFIWGLMGFFIVLFVFTPDSPANLRMGIISIFVTVLLVPFLWAPRGYILQKNLIIVKRMIGDLEIIVSKEPKFWKWTWWGGRLWASGGLYGYFGIFIFKGIGTVRMYATNRNNLVLVEDVKHTKYLVSPENVDRFMDLLKRSLVA